MTEPPDTPAMQQPDSEKEIDVNLSVNTPLSRSWATGLPSLVVERIYLFLNRRDQSQMSMVCKNWAEVYKCPNLWRYLMFAIPSKNCSSEFCPEVRRAQIFGDMFHHVKIICVNHSSNLNKVITDQFLQFIEALTSRSQLLSFHIEITFLHLDLDQEIYEKIFRSILHFIHSQNNMKIIRFINTYLEESKFVQILEVLFIKKPATLKRLDLIGINQDYNDKTQDFFQNARGLYDMLRNVEHLFIDYSHIFERIILCLKDAIECNKLPLRQNSICIILYFYGSLNVIYQGIESKAWEILRKHWPTLKVELYFIALQSLSLSFEKLVVKCMPLTYFECNLLQVGIPRINDVFRHLILTEVSIFLEVIRITSTETTHYVQDLIALLVHCPNLEHLTIDVQLYVTGVDILFNFISANVVRNLSYFCIKLPGLSPEVLRLYNDVIKKYSTIMREMGITIHSRIGIENSALKMYIICTKVSAYYI